MSDLDISDFSTTPSASASDATQRAKKRPAGPRFIFTVDERHVFRNIIAKYRDVIENKRTDNTTKKAKDEAWSQLCEDYNSLAGTRTVCVAQLRKLWDNMKSRWKKKKSEETREIFRTGGGTLECRPMSPATELVGAVADHMATRLPNPFDSDGAHVSEAVLSLPPAALLEAMVNDNESSQGDFSSEVPAPTSRQAAPSPRLNSRPLTDEALPVQEECLSAGRPTVLVPVVPSCQSVSEDIAPAQIARTRAGGPRVAAVERTLAPEVAARIKAIEAEDRRKEELHQLDLQLRRSQLAEQRLKNKMQHKLLSLDVEIKKQQLEALKR
ncbi:uncharacterized protein LOC144136463 [Amblyomma americanum]